MFQKPNLKLTAFSQSLRKNMTPEERKLWYCFLRNQPFSVKRQKKIGNYIVDFCIPSKKIVIELDGGQHYQDINCLKDIQRDQNLISAGFTVLRYNNILVQQQFEDICRDIEKHLFSE